MKRILVLNYEFPPLGGGASPVSFELAQKLSETGDFDIDVVTMGYKDLPKFEQVNEYFRIHRVSCLRSKKEICHPWEQATYLVTGYLKAKELVTKRKYDVCHCHFIIPTGVIALKLKKEFGLPYIITSHGSDVLGYGARFKYLYPFLVKPWKKILDEAKKIISPSNFLKGEILKVYPKFDAEKIEVIPNGFDTKKFQPQEKKKWIFSSGRLLPNKGFQYLIQAVSDEDIGYEVHIAGDGPMMGELKRLAEKSKTKVVFHGWMDNSRSEYKTLMEQSAIFVLASKAESFGMVVVEAMSAGCAVVVASGTGTEDLLSGCGLFTKFGNVSDIQNKIELLIQNKALMNAFQKQSFERVKTIYDWGVLLKKYSSVLDWNL